MKRRKFIGITLPLAMCGVSRAESSSKPDLVFGVIADPQYADADMRMGRYYRNSLDKLGKAVEDLNGKELSFVVTLGDLIDKDFKSFDAIMPIYEKLKHPHHPVLGNHDFEVADEDKPKVVVKAGLEKAYYSKSVGNWRFLFVDGTDVGIWRYPAEDPRTAEAKEMLAGLKEKKIRNALPYNAAVGEEQMKWLEAELDTAKEAKQQVVVFNHYPVIPAGDPHNLWNSTELVELLSRYDHVAAYMNGHNHKGNYGEHRGCHYVNLKGMVETEDKSAYATVRCFADRLEIEGYGMEPDRDLKKL